MRRTTVTTGHPNGDWELDLDLGVIDGRLECVGITFRPKADPPGHPLTSDVLRRTPLQRIVDDLRIDASDELLDLVGMSLPKKLGELAEAGLGPLAVRRPQPGRPQRSVEALEQAASIYNTTRRAPTKAVAEQMGYSHSGASKLIAECRARGLIPPTTAGRRS